MKVLNKFLTNGTGNYVEGVVNGRTGSGPVRSTSSEIVETITRRNVDLCCIQEVRWRGASISIFIFHVIIMIFHIFCICVCRKGVGSNSIYCAGCSHWVHNKCSGVTGSLKSNPDYRCSRCKGTARPIDGRPHNEWLLMQDKKLDVVDSFCYLGDTIGAGSGCDLSVITRI